MIQYSRQADGTIGRSVVHEGTLTLSPPGIEVTVGEMFAWRINQSISNVMSGGIPQGRLLVEGGDFLGTPLQAPHRGHNFLFEI